MPPKKRHLSAVTLRRAVSYVRVSSLMGRGGSDFHSPELQLGAIRRKFEPLGYTEVDVIEDIDETGRTFARDGIDKIRELAYAGKIDAVAVLDVSRLGRNVLESLLFLNELADRGVVVISAVEDIDTATPVGRFMLNQFLSIAQYRGEEIGAGWARLIDRRARAGYHHGAPPLGYKSVEKALHPDPELAPVITECFKRYARGDGVTSIGRYLAEARGRPMKTVDVRQMLARPAYAGFVTLHDEVLPGNHTPLVTMEIWQAVQTRLAAETNVWPSTGDGWFGLGLTVCPDNHRIQQVTCKEREGRVVRLVCGHAKFMLGSDCAGIGRPRLDVVEREVLRQVEERIQYLRTNHIAYALSNAPPERAGRDRDVIDQELAKVRRAMVKLVTDWSMADGSDLPEETYRAALADLKARETALAVELRPPTEKPAPMPPAEAANAAEALLKLWPEMLADEKVAALRTVADKIVVRPAQYWRESPAVRTKVHFL